MKTSWTRLRKPPRLLAQLVIQRMGEQVGVSELQIPINLNDLADSSSASRARRTPQSSGAASTVRPRIAWVTIPPGAGSGGHTTLFRMIRAAQDAGFQNTLLLYNRYHADLIRYSRIIRDGWPWLECEIAPLGESITGYEACVASSWPTAHVIANRSDPDMRAIYFIQDYEPFFYPRGDIYSFAEDTYRFGFRNIALGPMIQRTLSDEISVESDLVPFGGDTSMYRLTEPLSTRTGIAFYAKPENHRRGYHLAVRTLQRFHAQHPNQPIHAYGDAVHGLPFPFINHGRLSVDGLVRLYNTVIAGLSLSFTNVSLVPEELLACGAMPVVNDTVYGRSVLDNPHIGWSPPTPTALAAKLGEAVTGLGRGDRAITFADSVATRSWTPTERAVVAILAEESGHRLNASSAGSKLSDGQN